jgi:prephenate dehydratase
VAFAWENFSVNELHLKTRFFSQIILISVTSVIETTRQYDTTMATDPKDNYITSVVFSIHDEVGALQQVLAVIKKHDLNMSRIESRPSTTREFDYDFFVDFSGADMARVMDFTDELRKNHRGEVISVKTTNLEATTSKSKRCIFTFPKLEASNRFFHENYARSSCIQ